ncbi:glycosyltransferase family 8 protein [Phanerochaete sordida]|uniref:glycogenin glucosyltransferase n=1 Tax=Phanerochaete sordida TaxID=48140 RepID=A0A9P3FYZ5_9APHY|nr:glycosyltransferase family 8 protein [Phanerochaete sordida]
MATPYAFVTLVSSDFYLPGALALAAALKDLHPFPPTPPEVEFQTVCLVTPETVDVSTTKLLRSVYNVVIGVEIIEQEDDRKLRLLGRPDLNTVLTKLHIFRLTQYSKIIFLDADVLPVSPISHLFTTPHEFAAVPDVGWPDIFNSGVLVATPGEDKFNELMDLQKTKGSWDGGDQGILNEWRGPNWHRLSFTYNTTPTAAYTYAPAYERFGSAIKAIHFIGYDKPWRNLTYRAPGIKSSETTLDDGTKRAYNYESLVDKWYDVYDRHYRMDPVSTAPNFQFDTYMSAWDAGVPAETRTRSNSGGALGLDDLRRIAVEGISSVASSIPTLPFPVGPVMGEYRSLPLEGRVDLMRPRKPEPEPTQEPESQREPQPEPQREPFVDPAYHDDGSPGTPRPTHIQIPSGQGDYFRSGTLPTPGPNEVPPAPYHHGLSLPPSQTPTPYYGPPSGYDGSRDQNSLQISYQSQSPQGGHTHQQPGQQHHSQHHRSHSGQQRVTFAPQDSSDSERTPPGTRYPPHQPSHHRQHSQGQTHQSGYASPKRGGRGGYETPPRQQHGYQEHRTHGGDHTPTQDQPWKREGTRGQQQTGQTQHHGGGHHYEPPHHHHGHHHQHQPPHQPQPQQQPPSQPQYHQRAPPPRPISPPKVEWNPAVEPPPKTPPPPSAFPQDTYYPNIWDQPARGPHDNAHHRVTSPVSAEREFFSLPPPSEIPDQLIREGQYSNVIGTSHPQDSPESVSSPPAPDKSKVHAVFPWEEKPRHVPRRVFPRTDPPPPVANYIESERTSSPISTPPPPSERSVPQVQPATSPLSSPWGGVGFSNAWDSVPSIQRYAQKLVGSPKIFPFQYMANPPPPTDDDWKQQWEKQREKEMQDRHDASSMDGDDEDEGDELDEEELEASEGSSRGKRNQGSRRRSRAQSLTRNKKKYRSRGIQANPDTSEQSIQTAIDASSCPCCSRPIGEAVEAASAPVPAPAPAPAPEPAPVLAAVTKKAPPPVGLGIASALLPSAVPRDFMPQHEQGAGTPMVPTVGHSSEPFPSLATPSGLRSPATLGSPRTYSPPKVTSPLRIPSPPKVTSPPLVSSPLRGPSSPAKAVSPKSAPVRPPLSPQASARPGSVRKLSTSSLTGSGSSRASSPVVGTTARTSQATPSPKHTRLSSLSPELVRSISTESAITPSPTTTHDSPITPADNTPRKGSRVWDPARGVDVFKRGSEEVLARFLRMGSFEEENQQRQAAA